MLQEMEGVKVRREFAAEILEADAAPPEATFDNVIDMMAHLDDTPREKDGRAFRIAMLINVAFWFLIVLPWFIFT